MPRGDKSSYTGKQRRQANDIEKGYEKKGVSNDEAERRAWATVNKQSGGAKKKSSGSHSRSHIGTSHRSSSRSRHSSGGRRSSRTRSRGRSRSRGFTMFGMKLPSSTPYILGGLGICGLIYGLMQIDTISEAVDPVLDDISEFFGLSERPELMAHRSFDTTMSTIH